MIDSFGASVQSPFTVECADKYEDAYLAQFYSADCTAVELNTGGAVILTFPCGSRLYISTSEWATVQFKPAS